MGSSTSSCTNTVVAVNPQFDYRFSAFVAYL
jgi:hypothetical protein